ncbi:MBL fold metallo-hydrolase [Ancylomarina longa]|uniref:MBL fold metallo-hydrolase n=1 Tax=Ancylomarina longa TaxID=2487017 RepID=A0A434AGM7_9BACT|nr:MBL fold metallo-hydrolase [Ancylomarina longa]RUT73526.1 MBL fold metallo-hydrolase [Ancylomarina longa]
MELVNIETGNFMCDGGAMFSVVPKVMWSRKYPCDENNYCNCAMRSMLVVEGDRKILIDNGTGDKQDETFFAHQQLNGDASLVSSIENAGFSTDDITDVVFTHLHFDHCGGAVKWNNAKTGYELVFPNATHWVSKRHWENYKNPNIRESDAFFDENIMPIQEAGRLRFVEKEGALFPNFEVRFFDGHTPGLMIPILKKGNQTIVFAGDFIPTVANIPVKWLASYDLNPTASLSEKESFLQEAVKNQYFLFFQHDIQYECCSLIQTDKGVKVDECFPLSSIK